MSQRVRMPCVVFVLIMLLPHVVICGNYGLLWGVRVGDRFNYTLQATFEGATYSESVYVQVDDLPDLDEPFSPYFVFPFAVASFYWANGSHFGLVDYSTSFLIVPIGNWTYLTTEMIPQLSSYISGRIIDTITVWGLEVSTYVLNLLWVIHLEISKSDGVPNLMHIQIYSGNSVYGDIEIVREGPLAPFLLGFGVALLVVFSAIVLLRRRQSIAHG